MGLLTPAHMGCDSNIFALLCKGATTLESIRPSWIGDPTGPSQHLHWLFWHLLCCQTYIWDASEHTLAFCRRRHDKIANNLKLKCIKEKFLPRILIKKAMCRWQNSIGATNYGLQKPSPLSSDIPLTAAHERRALFVYTLFNTTFSAHSSKD